MSGVLAVVAFGLFLGKDREAIVGRSVEHRNHEFWETCGFLCNSLVSSSVLVNRISSGKLSNVRILLVQIPVQSFGEAAILHCPLSIVGRIVYFPNQINTGPKSISYIERL